MEKEEYRKLYELEEHLWWFVGMRAISFALLDRFRSGFHPLLILDAGCGTGGMLSHLDRYGRAVGIDVSPEALHFARQRRVHRLAQASVLSLPFPDETFDCVTSFDVIYHRKVTSDEQALAEMARVLRPGGLLLVRAPAHDRLRSRHDDAVHTRQRYARMELRAKLERTGFEPAFLSYANCLLFPLAALKRLSERLLAPHKPTSDVAPLPPLVNGFFAAALRMEAWILRRGKLPFGLSLVAVARRLTNSPSGS